MKGFELLRSGYIRQPWNAVRYSGDGYEGYAYLGGMRVRTELHKTLQDARAELDEIIAAYTPTEKERRIAFGERSGYYVVNENDNRLSVWRYSDGRAIKHAGPCYANPYTSRVSHLDEAAKEPTQFGADYSYYVTHGRANLGVPDVHSATRQRLGKAKGKRTDMAEVNRLIAEGYSASKLAAEFQVSKRTAYRWLEQAKNEGA